MQVGTQAQEKAKEKAKEIVEFWKNRRWLGSPAPIHVHQFDLVKLEELIQQALEIEPKSYT